MSEQYLALYLDSPMQSYGVSSRFDRRDSLSIPTRSAVTGIIAAAIGIARDDTDALSDLATLKMDCLVLNRCLHNDRTRKNKTLQSSRLVDYHTIGGGYKPNIPNEKICIPRSVDGKNNDVVQSYREYLLDARFGIVLSNGKEGLLERCHQALIDPVWGIWLGRKCCIPASPVDQGLFNSRDEAVATLCELAGCQTPQRFYIEVTENDVPSDTLLDIPITFDQRQRVLGGAFKARQILESLPDGEAASKE